MHHNYFLCNSNSVTIQNTDNLIYLTTGCPKKVRKFKIICIFAARAHKSLNCVSFVSQGLKMLRPRFSKLDKN